MLLGDEAVAQGAIDAGVSGLYGYPGTPSTEIITYAQRTKEARDKQVIATWTVNEKTAMETALGMSFAGKRSMVTMKHVGLNVAADAFINSAISGINGGLVVTVADDPSMHSSQNEQDSRVYGKFAMVPILEPSTPQEAYNLMSYAFNLSEKVQLPVLMRLTTRLAHSRSTVLPADKSAQNELKTPENSNRFILMPSNAKGMYQNLIAIQDKLIEISENDNINKFKEGKNKKLGIIASGIGYTYLMDNFSDSEIEYPTLKISQYPLPISKIKKLYDECDQILVIEEGYPVIEEFIKDNINPDSIKIIGKLTGHLPRTGELNSDYVKLALGDKPDEISFKSDIEINRMPAMCTGCGHRDLYDELNEITRSIIGSKVFADIGCYTLGALPPYEAIDTCIDMGASITMAKGAADAGLFPAIAVIGDSTFTHSGMTGLLDAVNDNSPITVLISDNYTTAMTGGQETAATGRIAEICRGIGVEEEHLKVIVPLKKFMKDNVEIIRNEINYKGVSVIIAQRECVKFYKKM
ncbi:MAG: thiamine pyrophosphate-dependent enzyme [Saprospiraceae bacterium]